MQSGMSMIMAAADGISNSTKLAEPKHFAAKGQQARLWLSTLKWYYITVCIKYVTTDELPTLQACYYAVVLMTGNSVHCIDMLEV